jgi:calcineurin-like phosphoesterase family protein
MGKKIYKIMNIFYTSDNHFFHTNIIKYCDRPFVDVNEMNETMIRNWNSVVQQGDLVIHGGDFALCNFDTAKHILECLNGDKILVRGNHDRSSKSMREMGFKEVVSLYNSGTVCVVHDPSKVSEDIIKIRDHILYGHTHERLIHKDKFINICVEQNNYTPKTLEQLLSTAKS